MLTLSTLMMDEVGTLLPDGTASNARRQYSKGILYGRNALSFYYIF
jgi:hypothetical protein